MYVSNTPYLYNICTVLYVTAYLLYYMMCCNLWEQCTSLALCTIQKSVCYIVHTYLFVLHCVDDIIFTCFCTVVTTAPITQTTNTTADTTANTMVTTGRATTAPSIMNPTMVSATVNGTTANSTHPHDTPMSNTTAVP